ncbi:Uncharacterised protein [Vibrio cholerae]|nr:Uncharacterised protein [Vibrio cholerae]CSI78211.1 Uncharacterised protein [Vibrio cholerae]
MQPMVIIILLMLYTIEAVNHYHTCIVTSKKHITAFAYNKLR